MNKQKTKQLSFAPVYHRRVNQGKYMPLPLRAAKHITSLDGQKAEAHKIVNEGFNMI